MKFQAVSMRRLSLSFNPHWQGLTLPTLGNTAEVTEHYNEVQHFWLLLAFKNRNSHCSHNIQKTEGDRQIGEKLQCIYHYTRTCSQTVNSDFSQSLSEY